MVGRVPPKNSEEVISRNTPTKKVKRLLVGTVAQKNIVKRLLVGTVPPKKIVKKSLVGTIPPKKSEEVIGGNSHTKKK